MSAILLASALIAQSLDRAFTYSCKAKLIDAALSDLSALSGVKLHASPEVGNEVVFFSVQKRSLAELMPKIALVTSSEWVKSGDGYTLKPAVGLQRKQQETELSTKAAKITKELREALAVVAKQKEDAKKALAAPAKEPAGSIEETVYNSSDEESVPLLTILTEIDPTILAQISGSTRVVWASNNATQTQLTMPEGSTAVIAEWIRQHNEAPKGVDAEPDTSGFDISDPAMAARLREEMANLKRMRQPISEPISKGLLVVQAQPFGSGLSATLNVLNAKGQVILTSSTSLEQPDPLAEPGPKQRPPSPSGLPPFQLSEDSTQISKLLDIREMGSSNAASDSSGLWAPKLREKMASTDLNDPLSFAASDVLDYYAATKKKDIIADVPDEFCSAGGFMRTASNPKDGAEAISSVEDPTTLELRREGDLVLIRPANPASARANRLPRKDFAKLARRLSKMGT